MIGITTAFSESFRKFITVGIFCLVILLLLCSCRLITPSRQYTFRLTKVSHFDHRQVKVIQVDNCSGLLPKPHQYVHPVSNITAENLKVNGGEPFHSLVQQLREAYGTGSSKEITVVAPPKTLLEATIVVTTTHYQGAVEGPLIEANKVYSSADVLFTYALMNGMHVEEETILPCP